MAWMTQIYKIVFVVEVKCHIDFGYDYNEIWFILWNLMITFLLGVGSHQWGYILV